LIFRGLKLRAFSLFCDIKKGLKFGEDFDPSFIFLLSMLKITPSLTLKYANVGGAVYGIPLPVNYWKKIGLGCR